MQTITVLGATGSIGCSTLDVVNRHPDKYRVFAITGYAQVELLMKQAQACAPRFVVLADDNYLEQAKQYALQYGVTAEILCGAKALEDVACAAEVDAVMAAIVGAAGLLPTLAAVKAGKKVLLANKEALVMSGALFIDAAKQSGAQILPIDSEHNAIFQCLPENFQYGKLSAAGIQKILLTGSGGPFRQRSLESFSSITIDEASTHPNWSMGRKITIDSATMMNKGLEFIEACWLFGAKANDIQVVIHPQSIIHSMVQYIDGSVIAQMGNPDMRTPIAYGLAHPERIDAGVAPLDFAEMANFTFQTPCYERYPNLKLAIQACEEGQAATTRLNAANEIAVSHFLEGHIGFCDIARVNEETLNQMEQVSVSSIQQILEQDKAARTVAVDIIRGKFAC
ncbi:1-deoxy-D-xylulose-5-phosphate reductoisomerase [Alteromonas australica]|uniref:1-deoxy-D-xylulose-5-phosphate reductoisomerase n=1 Tax=Alteromonas australica TaxID=589873 RepID=UPI000E943166|nr:1-deoxy-D-xylulose-5-phosphate reductoisomerase [Alteromonas australica]HBF72032.1 1-deoxy-D-xylulose-5-phosphate reductoisomerase [Alteromonas australica]|tara:strand:- start:15821 stop:17008 length:1188 start_codon:yes stop_codon:yes gene_type:complete